MKKKILIVSLVVLLMAGVGFGTWAIATSSGYGTSSDPLVTLSYLNNKLTPDLLSQLQKQLDSKVADMNTSLQKQIQDIQSKVSQSSFVLINIQSGQTVTCSAGTELLMRSGSAIVSSAVTDLTGGGVLSPGDVLKPNYMYLAPGDGTVVTAAGAATFLIRGTYKLS